MWIEIAPGAFIHEIWVFEVKNRLLYLKNNLFIFLEQMNNLQLLLMLSFANFKFGDTYSLF